MFVRKQSWIENGPVRPVASPCGAVRGMGQACDSGYTLTTNAAGQSICQSVADYTIGAPCLSSSFPFVGTYDASANCAALPAPYSYLVPAGLALLGLMLLKKGGR